MSLATTPLARTATSSKCKGARSGGWTDAPDARGMHPVGHTIPPPYGFAN